MTIKRTITTLDEDLRALGLAPLGEACNQKNEACKNSDDDEMDDEGDDEDDDYLDDEEDDEVDEAKKGKKNAKGTKIDKIKMVSKKGGMKEDESDPIDGKYFTKELADRIRALPMDQMESEQFEAVLKELSEKEVDDNDLELVSEAKEIVAILKEGAANRLRRFKAGSTARKTSFQCPQGFRAVKVGSGKGRPKCVPAHVAAGGMGSLNKEARKKAKWSRGGKGKMSQMRSARAERRRGAMRGEEFSPLALELMSISEGISASQVTVRDELVDQLGSIFELLSEEFMDSTVTELYEDAMSSILEQQSAGRLDEDVLNEDEFITAIEPVVQLVVKSVEKLENGELGNV